MDNFFTRFDSNYLNGAKVQAERVAEMRFLLDNVQQLRLWLARHDIALLSARFENDADTLIAGALGTAIETLKNDLGIIHTVASIAIHEEETPLFHELRHLCDSVERRCFSDGGDFRWALENPEKGAKAIVREMADRMFYRMVSSGTRERLLRFAAEASEAADAPGDILGVPQIESGRREWKEPSE